MSAAVCLRLSAMLGFLAVALGAFGAHSLNPLLVHNQTLSIWEKAVFYHFIHTIMMFVLATRRPFIVGPWYWFLAGVVIFSGSLYLLAITNQRWLGAVTPVGGLSFLAGWLWLALARPKEPTDTPPAT